ncbi:MAG: glycoside hydrolase family 3 protein [Cyclobacteriaceae bacterium]|nr:glycoside hydrolase family 3 protein [Cyclobacteriaceae bacterium SS2]
MKRRYLIITLLVFGSVVSKAADSLEVKIGQMILIGLGDFSQTDQSQPIFQELRDGKAGGIILFEKNLSKKNTESELKSVLEYSQSQSPIPLFVGIDEEGGRVTRLKTQYGFPKTVSAEYLGKLDNVDSTKYYALERATLLKDLGFNMNFAPCVDVNVNPNNPVIGKLGRSYSGSEKVVAKHAQIVISSYNSQGVIPVMKHFPGHGSSQNDSHLGVADVSNTWEFRELHPYKALIDSGIVNAVMTAHIVNRSLDAKLLPSTLSNNVVSGLLRGFLGYEGVVVSDDLQMKAIADHYGLKETIRLSLEAGLDILLFANNVPDYQLVSATQIVQIIKEMVQEGVISAERIEESYQRIMKLKQNIGLIE